MHLGTSINRLTNLLLTSTLTSWNSPFFFDLMTDTVSRPQLLTGDQKVFMQLSEGKVTVRVGGAYIPLSQWTKELTAVGEKGTKKWKMSVFFLSCVGIFQ